MRINLYAQNRHSFIVDGIPMSGFGEGDWLTLKLDGNAAERTQGGDGASMNISVSQGGVLVFSLNPTSLGIGPLYALREAQQKNPRMFSIAFYSGVDELITASGCAFGDLPQWATGGPKQTARQFALECLKVNMDKSAVETILGGYVGGIV